MIIRNNKKHNNIINIYKQKAHNLCVLFVYIYDKNNFMDNYMSICDKIIVKVTRNSIKI